MTSLTSHHIVRSPMTPKPELRPLHNYGKSPILDTISISTRVANERHRETSKKLRGRDLVIPSVREIFRV